MGRISLPKYCNKLWRLKDSLQMHVAKAELRKIQSRFTGVEDVWQDRYADGVLFGALKSCPLCYGHLQYSRGMYRCHGFSSPWINGLYSTTKPERVKGKWKIPDKASNDYLLQWYASQEADKPPRILTPPSNGEMLEDLKVDIVGLPAEEMSE